MAFQKRGSGVEHYTRSRLLLPREPSIMILDDRQMVLARSIYFLDASDNTIARRFSAFTFVPSALVSKTAADAHHEFVRHRILAWFGGLRPVLVDPRKISRQGSPRVS